MKPTLQGALIWDCAFFAQQRLENIYIYIYIYDIIYIYIMQFTITVVFVGCSLALCPSQGATTGTDTTVPGSW
jgi:hypothetical protein